MYVKLFIIALLICTNQLAYSDTNYANSYNGCQSTEREKCKQGAQHPANCYSCNLNITMKDSTHSAYTHLDNDKLLIHGADAFICTQRSGHWSKPADGWQCKQ
jgi:hypothetical protein